MPTKEADDVEAKTTSNPAPMNSNRWVAVAIVLGAAIVAGGQFLSAKYVRYGIQAVPDSRSSVTAVWRIDRLTGTVSRCEVPGICRSIQE
jgi:hypothetical protein